MSHWCPVVGIIFKIYLCFVLLFEAWSLSVAQAASSSQVLELQTSVTMPGYLFIIFAVLHIEPRAFYVLGKFLPLTYTHWYN
jgi:hypothetical protein